MSTVPYKAKLSPMQSTAGARRYISRVLFKQQRRNGAHFETPHCRPSANFRQAPMAAPPHSLASVRSKPELIADLRRFFLVCEKKTNDAVILQFKVRAEHSLSHIPQISYDCLKRQYLFDSRPFDVPAESRRKPVFSISHDPVVMTFPLL